MAESAVFYYETEVEWKKEKEGQIRGPSLPAVTVGAAPEFKGREGIWSPEHLFVASLNTLFLLTLALCLPFSRSRKIPSCRWSVSLRQPRASWRKCREAVIR